MNVDFNKVFTISEREKFRLPGQYGQIETSINFEFMLRSLERRAVYMASSKAHELFSVDFLNIEDLHSFDLGGEPIGIQFYQKTELVVGFKNPTIDRKIFKLNNFRIEGTDLLEFDRIITKSNTSMGDRAVLLIENHNNKNGDSLSKCLFLVGERNVEVVDLVGNTVVEEFMIYEWMEAYPVGNFEQGFIRELKFSDYVLIARQGEPKIVVKKYQNRDVDVEESVINTGMFDIISVEMSPFVKTVYISDRSFEFMSSYTLDQIGCGNGPLIDACGTLFFDSVLCKEFSIYSKELESCICKQGYFE